MSKPRYMNILHLPLAPIKYNFIESPLSCKTDKLCLLHHSVEKRAVSAQSIASDRHHVHQIERCIHNTR